VCDERMYEKRICEERAREEGARLHLLVKRAGRLDAEFGVGFDDNGSNCEVRVEAELVPEI